MVVSMLLSPTSFPINKRQVQGAVPPFLPLIASEAFSYSHEVLPLAATHPCSAQGGMTVIEWMLQATMCCTEVLSE